MWKSHGQGMCINLICADQLSHTLTPAGGGESQSNHTSAFTTTEGPRPLLGDIRPRPCTALLAPNDSVSFRKACGIRAMSFHVPARLLVRDTTSNKGVGGICCKSFPGDKRSGSSPTS